jgi:hypothetical protein
LEIIRKAKNHKYWQGCEGKGTLFTVDISMDISQKTKYDPFIKLLGINLKEFNSMHKRHTCIHMFIAAFTKIGKLWKQMRCAKTELR